ncbi:MAG: S41 family peptidase [Cyclobacteriaceae bacterium]
MSDEAAALNWDKFAAYGSREVEKCNNSQELHLTLLALFKPVALSIQIFAGKEESFTIKSLTPPDTAGFKVVTWQHLGLGLGHPKNIYSSVRTNRKSILSNDRAFSTITAAVEMEKYRNKEFRLTGSVRLIDGPGTAQLWARIDKPNQKVGFFDNMDDRPIASAQWKTYDLATIIGQPSAGTNGNVNMFQLPGGYRISWTGMKVLKHDGSQLHGVGILPDVYVEKTIKGVRQNQDEFLDKAIS